MMMIQVHWKVGLFLIFFWEKETPTKHETIALQLTSNALSQIKDFNLEGRSPSEEKSFHEEGRAEAVKKQNV